MLPNLFHRRMNRVLCTREQFLTKIVKSIVQCFYFQQLRETFVSDVTYRWDKFSNIGSFVRSKGGVA